MRDLRPSSVAASPAQARIASPDGRDRPEVEQSEVAHREGGFKAFLPGVQVVGRRAAPLLDGQAHLEVVLVRGEDDQDRAALGDAVRGVRVVDQFDQVVVVHVAGDQFELAVVLVDDQGVGAEKRHARILAQW